MNKSYYQLVCSKCQHPYKTTEKIGKCPKCGIEYEIIWPGVEIPKVNVKVDVQKAEKVVR